MLGFVMEQYEYMIAWEEGNLSPDEEISLFQSLIDSGLAWKLQGCYGRRAKFLIEAQLCFIEGGLA